MSSMFTLIILSLAATALAQGQFAQDRKDYGEDYDDQIAVAEDRKTPVDTPEDKESISPEGDAIDVEPLKRMGRVYYYDEIEEETYGDFSKEGSEGLFYKQIRKFILSFFSF